MSVDRPPASFQVVYGRPTAPSPDVGTPQSTGGRQADV